MRLVVPPTDKEKYGYIKGPQHRWFFWAHVAAFVGIAISLYGFCRMTYWTLIFLIPLFIYFVELGVGLLSSTFRRQVTMPDHRMTVELWKPESVPSVDVFLPTAGEPLELLVNTYKYVQCLEWRGTLKVWVLDDMGRDEVRLAAQEYGFGYLNREGSEFKKAGNLRAAYDVTDGDHIVIFDADFVPRPEFLLETVPYMDDPRVGIVQTPQVFPTPRKGMHWLERAAGATQEMFYRFIQPSRDAVEAAICCGTSAVYRRSALALIGGFPAIAHSEDLFTGVEMTKHDFRLQYVPVNLSQGICPDDLDSFVSQQYRWAEGTLELLKGKMFHTHPSITKLQRVSFWSGALYYSSTAMNAFFAPIPAIIMFWLFPQNVKSTNFIPLIGLVALWTVIYPVLFKSHWRLETLRVQAIYAFTHAVAIRDIFFGTAAEWVPSGVGKAQGKKSMPARVRKLMIGYITTTQTLIFSGLIFHMVQTNKYSLSQWWVAALFAAVNGYIFVPVAWLSLKTTLAARSQAKATPKVVVNTPVAVESSAA